MPWECFTPESRVILQEVIDISNPVVFFVGSFSGLVGINDRGAVDARDWV